MGVVGVNYISNFIKLLLVLSDNKLLMTLRKCEPQPLLALPNPSLPNNQYKYISTLSDLFDRELVSTIGWAKQIPGEWQPLRQAIVIHTQKMLLLHNTLKLAQL